MKVGQEALHAGRPLDSTRNADLRRAALELVAEIGYDRLTIDAVATRVRAGKATVYRRWASKDELVVDAFAEEMFGGMAATDTGSLRDDLVRIATHIWAGRRTVPTAQVMAGLMTAMLSHPELREAVKKACLRPESAFRTAVDRAVQRGEIESPPDPELLGWVLPSMCIFRLMRTGEAPDTRFCSSVIDHVIIPALLNGGQK